MKKSYYFIAILVSTALIISSCSKVGGTPYEEVLNGIDNNDSILPVINVLRPTANQVYKSSDSIVIEGKATDDKKMYKGKTLLTNDLTGFQVAEQYYETHFLQQLNFRMAYKAIVTSPTDFTVSIEFEDHGLNKTTQTLKVKVNP